MLQEQQAIERLAAQAEKIKKEFAEILGLSQRELTDNTETNAIQEAASTVKVQTEQLAQGLFTLNSLLK